MFWRFYYTKFYSRRTWLLINDKLKCWTKLQVRLFVQFVETIISIAFPRCYKYLVGIWRRISWNCSFSRLALKSRCWWASAKIKNVDLRSRYRRLYSPRRSQIEYVISLIIKKALKFWLGGTGSKSIFDTGRIESESWCLRNFYR